MSRVSYPLSGGGSGLDIAAIQNPGSTEAELNFALRNRTLGFGYDPQNSNGLNFCIKQGLVQYDVTGSVYDIDNATVTLPDNTTCAIILCPELPYADRFQVLDYNAYTTRQMPLTRLVLYEVSTSNGSVVGITDRRMAQPLSFASWGGLSDFAFIRTEVNPGFGGSGIVAHIKAGRVATSAGMVSFGDAPYVLLTDNAVNYVELDVGAVTVTANPNSFNGSNIPLYILYVENGVCTTAQDYRAFLSVPGSSGIAKRELEITLTPDGLVLTQDQMCYDIIVVNTYGSGGPEDLYVPEVNSDIRLWGHQVIIQFGQWANTADTVRVHNTTNDHAWTAKDAAGNDLFALSDASPYVTLGSPGDSVSITGHAPMFCLDGDVMWANWDAPALQFDYATVLQGIKQINSLPLVPLPLVAAVPVDTFPYVLRMNDTMAYVWHDGAQNNMFEVVDMSVPVLPRTNRILGGLSAEVVGSGGDCIIMRGQQAFVASRTTNNVAVIDVSNPAAPVLIASISCGDSTTPQSLALDATETYLFVALQDGGAIQTWDLTNLLTTGPGLVKTYAVNTNSIKSYNGHLYAQTFDGGVTYSLTVFDASDPAGVGLNQVGSVVLNGQSDFEMVMAYYNVLAIPHINTNTIDFVDITTPASPTLLGSYSGVTFPTGLSVVWTSIGPALIILSLTGIKILKLADNIVTGQWNAFTEVPVCLPFAADSLTGINYPIAEDGMMYLLQHSGVAGADFIAAIKLPLDNVYQVPPVY